MIDRDTKAGFGERLIAAIVDGIILGIGAWVLARILPMTASNGLSVVLGAAYYTYFESTPAGQTPGKRLFNLRVLDAATGEAPEPMKAFLRYLCSFVSAIPCFIGYLWMLWGGQRDTWHDKLSGTACVSAGFHPVP